MAISMKLLLHTCCGPCAVRPLPWFSENGFDVTGFFYNPNIHPRDEFDRRAHGAEKFYAIKNVSLIVCDDYMQELWESLGAPPEAVVGRDAHIAPPNAVVGRDAHIAPPVRLLCEMCYEIRLAHTAKRARESGFDAFSTTLLVSPYQNHELIVEICEKASAEYGVRFFYRDFRPDFRAGQREAREIGLYMQKYCGCIHSAR